MAIKYLRLGHVALRCNDYKKMRDFYVDTLGFEELFHINNDKGELWLTYIRVSQGQFIELFPDPYVGDNKMENRSHHHFCFELSDYSRAIRMLEEKGVEVHSGPVSMTPRLHEPYENHPVGMCGSLCAFIKDPEGNDIELMQFTPKSMQISCDKQKEAKKQ